MLKAFIYILFVLLVIFYGLLSATAQTDGLTNQGNRAASFDFDGDGKTDFSVFRAYYGEWWYQRSSDYEVRAAQFGIFSDRPVPGDYDGDGKTDPAVFRGPGGMWYVWRSGDGGVTSQHFGLNGDQALPNILVW